MTLDTPSSGRPNPPDRPGFWIGMAGISAALGAIGITIAVTEYHPPWSSAWFIAGTALCALGCVFAVWALVLYLARKVADDHWCPDPQAHVISAGLPPPDAQEWLRPVLREMNGDLRQASAAIEKARGENSYLDVKHQFETGHRWEANSEGIAGLTGPGNLYDILRDAYSHIVRLNGIISGPAITPVPSHDLATALTSIRNAQAAVSTELAELG
jgi:hypothetical protein